MSSILEDKGSHILLGKDIWIVEHFHERHPLCVCFGITDWRESLSLAVKDSLAFRFPWEEESTH